MGPAIRPPVVPPPVQSGFVIVFVSRVTAPFSANSLPFTVALVVAVMESLAMTVPTKLVPVPRVAELPTRQKTLHAFAH